jgi:hypothetical protein
MHPYGYGSAPQPEYRVPLYPKFGTARWWICVAVVVAMVAAIAYVAITADRSDPGVGYGASAEDGVLVPIGPADQLGAVTICSTVGGLEVEMPVPASIEGPLQLTTLPQPATVDGAWSVSGSGYRYRAVLVDVDPSSFSSTHDRLQQVVSQLDGDPTAVTFVDVFDRTSIGFEFDDGAQRSEGVAYSVLDAVIVLDVGVPAGSGADPDGIPSRLSDLIASWRLGGSGSCTPSGG